MEAFYTELQQIVAEKPLQVFFRADDIGKIDDNFTVMMEMFHQYRLPLCLAVVPQWMTAEGWLGMSRFGASDGLWCWHQHGYCHENHEKVGKNNEFGGSRSETEVRKELKAGYDRLATLLGDAFYPVFTPPWNRCSRMTLNVLQEIGYHAVSRSIGVQPEVKGLPDFQVNVDLHTAKEKDGQQAVERLLGDCRQGVRMGRLGIMLHHQRMNNHAVYFLERLLQILSRQSGITFCTYRDFIDAQGCLKPVGIG